MQSDASPNAVFVRQINSLNNKVLESLMLSAYDVLLEDYPRVGRDEGQKIK